MTKIYDTQQQIERERLQQEASYNHSSQMSSSLTGVLGISTGSMMLNFLDKLDPSRRTLAKALGVASIVIGALSFGMSFLSYRWARKAEDQIKQIDREQRLGAAEFSTNENEPASSQHVARYQQEQLSGVSKKSL